MKNYRKLATIGLSVLLVLGLLSGCTNSNQSEPTKTQPPTITPSPIPTITPSPSQSPIPTIEPTDDFTLNDLEGKTVKLGDFYGQRVVLYFWGYYCIECREKLELVKELFNKKNIKDLAVIAISNENEGSLKNVKKYVKDKGYMFTCLHDMTGAVSEKYGAKISPAIVFIDRKGKVFAKNGGTIEEPCKLDTVKDFTDVIDKME